MILSFVDKRTERVWKGEFSRDLPKEVQLQGRKKLRMINNAQNIEDLKVPPGNRLELLKGNRIGIYSIRINDQWRICFKWNGNNAELLEIVDYHQ
ncbi:plasmid maintenance system killer protein [Leptospira yanagawae serovar Saopaulo str. Sao Paulo = ATCC 700523]|uniref:Plasmid maintenance system killer protein n=1 Tax=Leptospira yanagawae serovar Saopaulo str. Sao Paulo = ATCC 700523 TaxID=1249483 RepID=A0A5E8HEZ5_9LEPT|nr:type II toxin-antitoxin system RelE/ParE family toxin [Leptospira yanagawae]EOQ89482.1 plasmid maintenance system killer protein [Leptospira yanagawae serovar Saopaulo str. Sao Paulo = ATCC 700523]